MMQLNDKTNPDSEKKEFKDTEKLVREWFPGKLEGEEAIKKRELSEEERVEKEKLKEEIEKLSISPEKEIEALKEAEEIKERDAEGKIKYLLNLAQDKGLDYSIKVAEKTGDALLIDLFHDILVKEGLFRKFLK